jgi:acyl dehydratase
MNLLENYTLAELNPGVTATYSKTLTYEDVVLFARCSGDVNPIHLDAEYAATTAFGVCGPVRWCRPPSPPGCPGQGRSIAVRA